MRAPWQFFFFTCSRGGLIDRCKCTCDKIDLENVQYNLELVCCYYSVQYDDKIELENVQLPPMLVAAFQTVGRAYSSFAFASSTVDDDAIMMMVS